MIASPGRARKHPRQVMVLLAADDDAASRASAPAARTAAARSPRLRNDSRSAAHSSSSRRASIAKPAARYARVIDVDVGGQQARQDQRAAGRRSAPESRAPAARARRPRCWRARGRCRAATSARLPTRVATVVTRLSARFSSVVATASESTSSASPRAAGHSSAAAIDRIPDPQPRSTNRSTCAVVQLLRPSRSPGASTRGRPCRTRGPDRCRSPDRRRPRAARPSSAGSRSCGRRAARGSTASRRRATRPRAPRGGEIVIGSGETPAARRRAQAASISASTSASISGAHCARITDRPPSTRRMVSGVADLDAAGQRADGVGQHLGRGRRDRDRQLDPRWTRAVPAECARQRTTRRFASRRRRFRASRILRLRFTDGFS